MRTERRGTTAIEFALILPTLLVLTFGIMDYGWFFMIHQQASQACREAARTGSHTALSEDPAASAAADAGRYVSQHFPLSNMQVSYDTSVIGGDAVQISLSVQFQPLVGFVPTPTTVSCGAERYLEDLD
jgi:Flp pilus assembly protein TadG